MVSALPSSASAPGRRSPGRKRPERWMDADSQVARSLLGWFG